MIRIKLGFFLLLILLISCDDDFFSNSDCVEGKGNIVTESRDLGDFHSIQNATFANIYLTQGPVEEVVIEAQENILDVLITEVKDGELRIKTDPCLEIEEAIEIWISIPEIKKLSLIGVGDIVAENDFVLDDLEIKLTGVGDFYLLGTVDRLDINLTGVGDVNAYDLQVDDCRIKITGVGNARVSVEDDLDVHISGVGSVYYRGNPTITTRVTGTGGVVKEG